jgi:EipB-like
MTRALALAAAVAILGLGAAAPPSHLASYRAVYEVTLEHTSGGVLAARGRMAVEFRDTCDGWATSQRLIADMTDSQGVLSRTDFFVTAWESKDGRTMRFDINNSHDGKVQSRQRGSAELAPDGSGHVELVAGKPAKFSLPRGTEFPTAQILSVLHVAETGSGSVKHLVFQGGDKTDLNFSTAVVGRRTAAPAIAADVAADRHGLVKSTPAWPVLISYFPVSSRAESPDYEVATHLFANGVNGSMSLVYPDYTLRATLARLEPLHASC